MVRLLTLALLVTSSFGLAESSRGETFHSNQSQYSITLSHDWTSVPLGVFQEALSQLGAARHGGFEPEAAFQSRHDSWFGGAYAITMVFSTESQLPSDQIRRTVAMAAGLKPEQIESATSKKFGRSVNVGSNTVLLDDENHRYVWDVSTQESGEPRITRTYGFIGRRSIVHLTFCGPPQTLSVAESIASSFRFDAGAAYEAPAKSKTTRWEHYVAIGLALAIVNYLRTAVPGFMKKRFPKAYAMLARKL